MQTTSVDEKGIEAACVWGTNTPYREIYINDGVACQLLLHAKPWIVTITSSAHSGFLPFPVVAKFSSHIGGGVDTPLIHVAEGVESTVRPSEVRVVPLSDIQPARRVVLSGGSELDWEQDIVVFFSIRGCVTLGESVGDSKSSVQSIHAMGGEAVHTGCVINTPVCVFGDDGVQLGVYERVETNQTRLALEFGPADEKLQRPFEPASRNRVSKSMTGWNRDDPPDTTQEEALFETLGRVVTRQRPIPTSAMKMFMMIHGTSGVEPTHIIRSSNIHAFRAHNMFNYARNEDLLSKLEHAEQLLRPFRTTHKNNQSHVALECFGRNKDVLRPTLGRFKAALFIVAGYMHPGTSYTRDAVEARELYIQSVLRTSETPPDCHKSVWIIATVLATMARVHKTAVWERIRNGVGTRESFLTDTMPPHRVGNTPDGELARSFHSTAILLSDCNILLRDWTLSVSISCLDSLSSRRISDSVYGSLANCAILLASACACSIRDKETNAMVDLCRKAVSPLYHVRSICSVDDSFPVPVYAPVMRELALSGIVPRRILSGIREGIEKENQILDRRTTGECVALMLESTAASVGAVDGLSAVEEIRGILQDAKGNTRAVATAVKRLAIDAEGRTADASASNGLHSFNLRRAGTLVQKCPTCGDAFWIYRHRILTQVRSLPDTTSLSGMANWLACLDMDSATSSTSRILWCGVDKCAKLEAQGVTFDELMRTIQRSYPSRQKSLAGGYRRFAAEEHEWSFKSPASYDVIPAAALSRAATQRGEPPGITKSPIKKRYPLMMHKKHHGGKWNLLDDCSELYTATERRDFAVRLCIDAIRPRFEEWYDIPSLGDGAGGHINLATSTIESIRTATHGSEGSVSVLDKGCPVFHYRTRHGHVVLPRLLASHAIPPSIHLLVGNAIAVREMANDSGKLAQLIHERIVDPDLEKKRYPPPGVDTPEDTTILTFSSRNGIRDEESAAIFAIQNLYTQ